jgi:DNA-binding CsgD family transcriptional regulator
MLSPEMNGGMSRVRLAGGPVFGREREREVLDRLLDGALNASSGVVVVNGEPGVGKTALLDYAVQAGREFRVARTVGIESEVELAFAALLQLCSSFLGLMDRLPQPQQGALAVAFGLGVGPAPSPFLVGLAVLGLLAEAAEQQPLLCVVDDAQWLDSASARALAFAARRLLVEKVAVIFATRELSEALAGFPELHVGPLGRRAARSLLESVLPAPLDESVLERVVAETRGNPLALLELPRGLTPGQLAGGFGLPAAVPLSASLQESYTRRLARLDHDARRLLLVAAADPTGDPALVWRAAGRLGIPAAAAQTVEAEDVLALSPRVVFRHPLVRSAVYRAAGPDERREIHRALAEATDSDVDPDRRAWHRAQAASVPDDEVAAELERSAARARRRGGFAAAAAFLERSFALTLDPAQRAGRALAAAEAQEQAGSLDAALALIETAQGGPLDEFQRAQADVLRARISFAADRGSEAPPLLLAGAQRFEPLDGRLARETYLDALTAAMFAGRLGAGADARTVAAIAGEAPLPAAPRASDLLLHGLALLMTDGHATGTPVLREALTAFRSDELSTEEGLRWLWLAGRAAAYIWDYDSWDALTARQIRLSREFGALTVLPLTLSTRAGVELFGGNLASAGAFVQTADVVTAATDSRAVPYAALALAAFRGREPDGTRLIATSTEDFVARGEGMGVTLAQWASAMLHNGLARYDEALAAAEQAVQNPRELWFATWAMVELIEAAARSGQRARATGALESLTKSTCASGTPWALGVQARSRALLSDDDAVEPLYREAIDHLQPTRLRVDVARTRLLYGEWLRRQRRRVDARNQLRTAHEQFMDFGMEAFAQRARIELEATGERARQRTVETLDQLTPQEAQIARLAAEGHTNREIAARLFISASTVEYHLRKAFRKLNVKSRTQLAHRLS